MKDIRNIIYILYKTNLFLLYIYIYIYFIILPMLEFIRMEKCVYIFCRRKDTIC